MKLSPKQKKIAAKAPPRNKIDGKDFAVLKAEKAKGRGMGLQDEKMKPGKIMRADKGKMIKQDPTKAVNPFAKRAVEAAKATKYGKIAAGVAAAALATKAGLEKLYEIRTGKKPFTKRPKKKMGGGMMKKPIKASSGLLAGVSGVKKAANIIDEKREQGIQKKVDRDAMINKARKAIQGKNKNRITERDLQTVSNIIIKNKDRLTDRELKTAQDIIKTIPRTMPKVKIRERDIGIQKIKELIKNRPRNKMGGGMMMRPRPMGYDQGDLASAENVYKKKKAKGRKKVVRQTTERDPRRFSKKTPLPGPGGRIPGGGIPNVPGRLRRQPVIPTPKLAGPQMSTGGSVTVKVKLGRNKPTKLY